MNWACGFCCSTNITSPGSVVGSDRPACAGIYNLNKRYLVLIAFSLEELFGPAAFWDLPFSQTTLEAGLQCCNLTTRFW